MLQQWKYFIKNKRKRLRIFHLHVWRLNGVSIVSTTSYYVASGAETHSSPSDPCTIKIKFSIDYSIIVLYPHCYVLLNRIWITLAF